MDKASRTLGRRPEWDRCREQLRCDDALAVTMLDRMGRSVRHLIDVVGELDRAGVELVVLPGHRHHQPGWAAAVPRAGRDGRVRVGT